MRILKTVIEILALLCFLAAVVFLWGLILGTFSGLAEAHVIFWTWIAFLAAGDLLLSLKFRLERHIPLPGFAPY